MYDASTLPAPLPASLTAAAGSLPGTFSVSPGGQANYHIPIEVPPGRLGMEPRLAIVYDSGSGDGPLGVGFSLQGLSAVTRCPANLAQDGTIAPVRYDDTDHFCLDGLRLVPVDPAPGSSAADALEYRTFPDTFAKVVAHLGPGFSGPASFEVRTKAGHVLQYGAGPNSRAMATGGAVAAWWLATEQDRRGNAVDYTYLNAVDPDDGHTQQILPSSIHYTRHGSTPATRAVVFAYDTITPPSTLYGAGISHLRSLALSRVETRLEPGDVPVRSYALTYGIGPASQRPTLESVQECAGSSGPCKPATRFTWSGRPSGFAKEVTPPLVPNWKKNRVAARWTMADVNGDGLQDLVMVDNHDTTTDDWVVALHTGKGFASAELWANLPHPASAGGTSENLSLTVADYDQDGNADILVDSPNLSNALWPHYRWIQSVPNGTKGHKLVMHDTAVLHPNGVPYDPSQDLTPAKITARRFARYGDINGDGIADLIECTNETWDYEGHSPTLGNPRWRVFFWVPSVPGKGGPGFDPKPVEIPLFDHLDCLGGPTEVYVVDVDGDGVSEILAPRADGSFDAFRFEGSAQGGNGGWRHHPTSLTLPPFSNRKIHFLDLNGDNLVDAVYTGYNYHCPYGGNECPEPPSFSSINGLPGDVPYQALNDGKAFRVPGWMLSKSLFPPGTLPGNPGGGGATDWWGDYSVVLDFNGDGRMDLMMPVSGRCGPGSGPYDVCWVVLQTNPGISGSFPLDSGPYPKGELATPIDTHIPVVFNDNSDVFAPWFLAQVADVDNNGTHDVIVPNPSNDGSFVIYRNGPAEGSQDLLVGITDGMSPLDPTDPGFAPSVTIQYSSLADGARTHGLAEDDAGAEAFTYLSPVDPAKPCAYPCARVVGSERVVSGFHQNDGQNRMRAFSLRYRDARYHRLGRGSLGFGQRILLDLDSGAGTLETYDNVTWDPSFDVYPFAGQVAEVTSWSPASAMAAKPTQVEVARAKSQLEQVFTDGRQLVNNWVARTYFTRASASQHERQEGVFTPGQGKTLLRWALATETTPALVLSQVADTASQIDGYGNVLSQDRTVGGLDLYDTLERDVANDPLTWLVGLVKSEKACSSTTLSGTQCRVTARGHDQYGEVWSAAIGDPTDLGTQLSIGYQHDSFGNVHRTIAADAFGHVRAACVSRDPDGIFPYASRDALGHTVLTAYDPAFGVMTGAVDANGLKTRWRHDGFGRVTEEDRPDGTWTSTTLTRHKDGGPKGKWWNVKVTTSEAGGASRTAELDGAGRAVHTWTRAAAVKTCGATACASCGAGLCLQPPTIEQETEYDVFGRVTRATVPWVGGDTLTGKYADTWEYDAAGRVTRHTEPWGRVTTFGYAANITSASRRSSGTQAAGSTARGGSAARSTWGSRSTFASAGGSSSAHR